MLAPPQSQAFRSELARQRNPGEHVTAWARRAHRTVTANNAIEANNAIDVSDAFAINNEKGAPRRPLLIQSNDDQSSLRKCGNSSTSRMFGESVRIMIKRSMPIPQPPAGGMPYSSARM